jgi:hypothetical protein
MGYTTEFTGKLTFEKTIPAEVVEYVNAFSHTRRMKRDNSLIKRTFPDWAKFTFNGSLGIDGEYFVRKDDIENFGQDRDATIVDYNIPPSTQPGLWCHWVIKDNCLMWSSSLDFLYLASITTFHGMRLKSTLVVSPIPGLM